MANHPNRCKTVLTTIPFGGFYNSLWSDGVDREEESFAENFADYSQEEEGIPAHLRLSQDETADILFHVTEYGQAYLAVANVYVDVFNRLASEEVGFPLRLSMESMTSPREYNFETDRIFCHIPVSVVRKLYSVSRREKHERLAAAIRDRFTSYDGFVSFYSNDLSTWLEKPLADWDHNEIGTLLAAIVGDIEEIDLYYAATDCDGFHHEWSGAVDWAKFDEKVAEKRAEKAEAWEAEHPGEEAPYRCPHTLDLFQPRPQA